MHPQQPQSPPPIVPPSAISSSFNFHVRYAATIPPHPPTLNTTAILLPPNQPDPPSPPIESAESSRPPALRKWNIILARRVDRNCGEEMKTLWRPMIVPAEVISLGGSGFPPGVFEGGGKGKWGLGCNSGVDWDGLLSSGLEMEIPEGTANGGDKSNDPLVPGVSTLPYPAAATSTGLISGVILLEEAILSLLETSLI